MLLHYRVEWYCYKMKSLLDAGKVHADRVLRDGRETIIVQVSNTILQPFQSSYSHSQDPYPAPTAPSSDSS